MRVGGREWGQIRKWEPRERGEIEKERKSKSEEEKKKERRREKEGM